MMMRFVTACVCVAALVAAGCGGSGSGCPAGQEKCNGVCVDTTADRAHCGSCGNACLAGQYCSASQCLACNNECQSGERRCATGSNNQFQVCSDLDGDTCMEWGNAQACSGGQICDQGQCRVSCADECDNAGQRGCTQDLSGWRTCGNFDADECLEWSQPTMCGTGETCDAGECKSTCRDECPNAGDRRCAAPPDNGFEICGNYDSDPCREWGGLTLCPGGQTCQAGGTCSSTCQDDCQAGQKICQDAGWRQCGNYDADPCLDWSGVTNCASWEVCESGACVTACTDACHTGDKQCSGDGFDVCGNYNADPCLEYGGHIACDSGKVCQNGVCVENCQNECTTGGQRRCDPQGTAAYQVCGNWDGDSCLEWSPALTNCDAGQSCTDGICNDTCADECQTGQRICDGSGWKQCGNYDSDPCLDWSTTTNCQSWEVCSNGQCVINCSNECNVSGQQLCVDNVSYHVCGNHDVDPCLEWSQPVGCGTSKKCDAATGTCVDDCTNECSQNGTQQCAGDGYDVCGNWDTDSCLEWGNHQQCTGGTTCSNGQCVATCSDECSAAGTNVCDGIIGWRPCGQFDADSCLDLGSRTDCGYGQECQNGACVTVCTDECTAGATRCDGQNVQICGNFDADVCKEWGTVNTCTANQICYRATCISNTPPAKVMVNEILYDDQSTDGEWVFIELWGPAGLALDNFSVRGINGNGGTEFNRISLDGKTLPTGKDGHFLIVHTNADQTLKDVADLVSAQADYQNGPDSIQVVWGQDVVVDALGYGSWGASDVWAGEGTVPASTDKSLDAGYTSNNATGAAGFCLSRDAAHNDSDNNLADFFKRGPSACSPGWAGPGMVLWQQHTWGGTSTPAVDSEHTNYTVNNVYTVDSYGWLNITPYTNPTGHYDVIPPTGSKLASSVAVFDDFTNPVALYVGAAKSSTIGGVYKLDPATGNPVSGWGPVASAYDVYSTPAVGSDGSVFFGTRGGGFYRFLANGTQSYNYNAATWTPGSAPWIDSSPTLWAAPSGTVYVYFGVGGISSGEVICLNAATGAEVWRFTGALGGCNSSPAVGSLGKVYIGCDDGKLYGFDAITGAPAAGFPVDIAQGMTSVKLVEGCSPVTIPGTAADTILMTSHSDGNNFYLLSYNGSTVTGTMGQFTYTPMSSGAFGADGSFAVHAGPFALGFAASGRLEWYAYTGDNQSAWIHPSPTWLPGGVILVQANANYPNGILYAIAAPVNPASMAGSFPQWHGDYFNSGLGW